MIVCAQVGARVSPEFAAVPDSGNEGRVDCLKPPKPFFVYMCGYVVLDSLRHLTGMAKIFKQDICSNNLSSVFSLRDNMGWPN